MTLTSSENCGLIARIAKNFGVPIGELADFLIQLGINSFARAFPTNRIEWWLIQMHSKYPDTFNIHAWEGSSGHLAIDKLYAKRGIPFGKYQEWCAAQEAEKAARRSKKRSKLVLS